MRFTIPAPSFRRSKLRSTPFLFDFSSGSLRFTIRCYESFLFRHRLRSIYSPAVLCDLSLNLGGDCSLLAIFHLLIFIYVRRISDSWFSDLSSIVRALLCRILMQMLSILNIRRCLDLTQHHRFKICVFKSSLCSQCGSCWYYSCLREVNWFRKL